MCIVINKTDLPFMYLLKFLLDFTFIKLIIFMYLNSERFTFYLEVLMQYN